MIEKFSVLLSLYIKENCSGFKEAIDSILNNTVQPTEIVLVKDGPLTNQLDELIDKYVKLYPGLFKIIALEKNQGLAKALNVGLKYCSYNIIARMDADDISLPLRFEKQLDYLKKNKDIECLGSWAIEINEDGSEYYRKKMPESHEACLNLFKKRDCLIHPSVMFRRSYFDKAGLYPEDTYFGEDTIMWAQGFASGCVFGNVPEYLLKFRLDSEFFDRRRGIKHAKSILSLRKRVNKMLGFGPKEYVYSYLYALAKLMPTDILNIIYKVFR